MFCCNHLVLLNVSFYSIFLIFQIGISPYLLILWVFGKMFVDYYCDIRTMKGF